jgi:carbonic anhydrase/acetyltransferase-like protein (isoleucine patch superfamily)
MLIKHLGREPSVSTDAWIAPDATVCGDVTIGAGARIMHGARVIAEGGAIEIGRNCIVMENAVVRATGRHSCSISDHVLIGPCAHVVGATIDDEVFIATGAAIFHGSTLGRASEVRVHGTVHLNARLAPGAIVPIGWIAVGDPAVLFSPDPHDEIWAVQKPLNFPLTVYGIDRDTPDLMRHVTEALSQRLAAHHDDKALG